ncbi:hypothetical protein NUU61_006242 [Penicillium alfredii]|uniref:Fe-S cluster assembly protein DRE2 n=1 Tax=Penicillium alfredii TaxID=1506179 RepID=A0A9W9F0I6_9EURO|nr:uncharacterized protein NUU61_006242 [Penicillium alfredii]KAJ5091372.1 hypothetical protein NUU61_006242 [Penicillium alfredii]
MAPSFMTIDTSDVDLAPPSKSEDKLRDIFTTFDRSNTDLQMLDRLAAGFVSLPATTYDLILVLTDSDGARRAEALQLLTRDLYTALVPAMKAGAKLQTQDHALDASESMEAVLAGLVQTPAGFEKPNVEQASAVPLRFGAKKNKKTTPSAPPTGFTPTMGFGANNDNQTNNDDELINEDTLLSEEDLTRPIVPPPECQPKTGRRRRACKDCTCGLADRLDAEDTERRANADKELNVMMLQSDDLDELDFTVQGKTGSCGSCALGDAFRCDGCPYMGLPAFKPGQEVQILNDVAQL